MGSDRASSRSTVSAPRSPSWRNNSPPLTMPRPKRERAPMRPSAGSSSWSRSRKTPPRSSAHPDGSASSGGSQEIELRSQLRDLESQLLQSEARARSAYAATEAAEAALRMAKEEGFIPSMHSEQEFRDLRTRLEVVTGRADQAERRSPRQRPTSLPTALVSTPTRSPIRSRPSTRCTMPSSRSPSLLHRTRRSPTQAPRPTPQDSDSWVAGSQPSRGLSFRKLAGAASGKKNRDGDPSGR